MENYPFVVWAGSVIGGILALFGAKEIVVKIVDRIFAKKDKQQVIHETNQQHQLEYDGKFIQSLLARVDTLERKLEDVQKENLTQAVKSERVSAENEHLKQDVQMLRKRNEELQTENKQQGLKIINLENDNKRLATELRDLKDLVNNKLK